MGGIDQRGWPYQLREVLVPVEGGGVGSETDSPSNETRDAHSGGPAGDLAAVTVQEAAAINQG